MAKAIHPLRFTAFPLTEISEVNHNTKIFRFKLHNESDVLGIGPGRHITVKADIGPDGEKVTRSYTPITLGSHPGEFDLLVKAYENGVMSRYIHSLKVGDTLEVRGPVGNLKYDSNKCEHLILLLAGSGLTPGYQLLKTIMQDPDDNTRVTFIFQNREERDILLRKDIDDIVANSEGRVKAWYFLSSPPENWETPAPSGKAVMKSGRVNSEFLKDTLPAPLVDNSRSYAVVCGTEEFNKSMQTTLEDLAYVLKDSMHIL